jgi:hypothetical protein
LEATLLETASFRPSTANGSWRSVSCSLALMADDDRAKSKLGLLLSASVLRPSPEFFGRRSVLPSRRVSVVGSPVAAYEAMRPVDLLALNPAMPLVPLAR